MTQVRRTQRRGILASQEPFVIHSSIHRSVHWVAGNTTHTGQLPKELSTGDACGENVAQVVGSSSGSRPGDATDRDRQPHRPETQSQTSATAASSRMPG